MQVTVNITRSDGKQSGNGNWNSLNLVGIKVRLRYKDESQGPLYEYTPKYGYRKEAPNYFIFGVCSPAEAIEIIDRDTLRELKIVPDRSTYSWN